LLARIGLLPALNIRDLSLLVEMATYRPRKLREIICAFTEKLSYLLVSKQHTHPNLAQARSSANQYMNDLVTRSGFEPFNVSRANHDLNQGSRYFYAQKDLATPFSDGEITEHTCFVFCDVDYYCDMNKWLKHFKPIVMYTLCPTKASMHTSEYKYHIQDSSVHFEVKGGASYVHQLWDYHGDTVSVEDDRGRLCVFNVEQKIMPEDNQRRIIWLVPSARVVAPTWAWLFEPAPLERKRMCHGDVITIYDPVADSVSLMRNKERHSVEIRGVTFAALQKRLQSKAGVPVVSDVERILRDSGDLNYSQNAPILFGLLEQSILIPNVVQTSTLQAHYQPLGTLQTEDGKEMGRVCHPSLVTNGAVFPTRSLCSDESTIRGRVHNVRNDVNPGPKYKVWAREFVKLLVPHAGKGVPISPDDVRVLQDTTRQRSRYDMVKHIMSLSSFNRLQSFIKAEAYSQANDPRNITTMSHELTIMMSCFTYSFKNDVLKKFNWYGPGKNPSETIDRVRELAIIRALAATDFFRFDGTMSEFLQKDIVLASYMRWCDEQRRAEFKRWFDQVFIKNGTTRNGVKFKPGYGTRSGSPITTDGNTMVNAFVSFCALRMLGYSPIEAFEKLGLYTGDDGLVPNYDNAIGKALQEVTTKLGLSIEPILVQQGEPVPFCGRYFVDPMVSRDSFQDPMRTIAKLHLTANKTVTMEQAITNKALGYLATDKLTPIIGSWADKVVSLTGLSFKGALPEEQYKRSNAWPQIDKNRILAAMAKVCGVLPAEIIQMDQLVCDVTALDQFPVLLSTEIKPKLACVLGDAVCEPEQRILCNDEQTTAANSRRTSASEPNSTTSDTQPRRRLVQQTSRHANQTTQPRDAANRAEQRGNRRPRGRSLQRVGTTRGDLSNRRRQARE